jgi:SAM-dependent methyltransferase
MARDMADFVYDEKIAKVYDLSVPLQPGEVDFYLELAREAQARGLRTLEVTCGTGRVAIPLAKAGIRLVGLDVSEAMLAYARKNSAGLDVEWVEGDMRSFDLGEEFGLVYIPVGSFQLLLEVQEQLDCLRCIHRHLAPGGRLAFEVENPNLVAIAEWLTTRKGTFVRRPQRDYVDPESGRRVMSWGSAEYHPSVQQVAGPVFTEELDEDNVVVKREFGKPLTVRYHFRYEMEHLLARAGFEIEALYGNLEKERYTATSPDFIWVARKP